MSSIIENIERVEKARQPADLFPPGADHEALHKKLLVAVHPDRATPKIRPRAEAAFKRVGELFAMLSAKTPATTIGKWAVEQTLCAGDVADLYLVRDSGVQGVLKIARDKADNDLLAAEHAALTRLQKTGSEFCKYVPRVYDTLEASSRRVNVLSYAEGYLSLKMITEAVGAPLDFRHCVWMLNRLLSLIGFVQREGFVHGGITPDHLLYHPKSHGLTLVGWGSVTVTSQAKPIPILSSDWSFIYPPEVPRKRPVHPATDIYMAAASIFYAAGVHGTPARFKPLFEHCMAASPASRPVDAWAILDRFKSLAQEEYGDPRYIELVLPVQ